MKLQEAKTTSGNKCVTQGKLKLLLPLLTNALYFFQLFFGINSLGIYSKIYSLGIIIVKFLENLDQVGSKAAEALEDLTLKGFTYVQVCLEVVFLVASY